MYYTGKKTFGTFLIVRLIEGVRLIEVCKSCAMFVFNDYLSTVILYCDSVVEKAVLYVRSNLQFIDR